MFSFNGDDWTLAGDLLIHVIFLKYSIGTLLTPRNQASIFKLSSSVFYVIGGWGDDGTGQPGQLAIEKGK